MDDADLNLAIPAIFFAGKFTNSISVIFKILLLIFFKFLILAVGTAGQRCTTARRLVKRLFYIA